MKIRFRKLQTNRERRCQERLRTVRRKAIRALKTLRQADPYLGTSLVRWVLCNPRRELWHTAVGQCVQAPKRPASAEMSLS